MASNIGPDGPVIVILFGGLLRLQVHLRADHSSGEVSMSNSLNINSYHLRYYLLLSLTVL